MIDGHVVHVATSQVRGQPRTPPDLQSGDLAIRHLTQNRDLASAAHDGRDPWQQANRCAQRRQTLAEPTGEQPDHHFDERNHEHLHHDDRKPKTTGERGDRARSMLRSEQSMRHIGAARRELFVMAGASGWHNQHAGPAEVRAPAQVEVLTVKAIGGLEPLQRPEQVSPNQ